MDMSIIKNFLIYFLIVIVIIFFNTNQFLQITNKQSVVQCSNLTGSGDSLLRSTIDTSRFVNRYTPSMDMSIQENESNNDKINTYQTVFSDYDPLYREASIRKNQCIKGIDFSSSLWWNQTVQQQKCIFKDYKREIPLYIQKKFNHNNEDKLYSQVYYNATEGIYWGYLKNVCYNMKTEHMELYKPNKDKVIKGRIEGFQHLWVYTEKIGEIPSDAYVNRGMNAWMIIPGWKKHTSHFSQNVFFINHRNNHPNWYPPMETLFIPNFDEVKEIKFSKILLNMLMSSSQPYNISFYGHNSMINMATGGRLCFDWLGINGHLGHHGAGGYFYQLFESDTFRAFAYHYYHMDPSKLYHKRNEKVQVLFLQRNKKSKGRQFLNPQDIKAVINKKKFFYSYSEELIDSLPMEEQVMKTMKTDILISVHGAAMATIVFLLPHSAIIELRPPYFRDNWYHVTSTSAKLIHIIHNNFSIPLPSSCPNADVTLNPSMYKECWLSVHYQDFYVDFLYLREYLEYAHTQVLHYKYHL